MTYSERMIMWGNHIMGSADPVYFILALKFEIYSNLVQASWQKNAFHIGDPFS